MIELYNADCLEKMKDIKDKSIDLCLFDPPYNIKKEKWDSWKSVSEYVEFMKKVFLECQRVLKDNGSMYFFHNDFEQICELQKVIKCSTEFIFNSFIIWDKGNFRAMSWKNPSDKNNLRSWFNTCEYIIYYVKVQGYKTKWDRTGWESVKLNVNNFASLRKYAYDMALYIGGGASTLTQSLDIEERSISSIAKSGRVKVMTMIGGRGDHFTRYGSTQWELCTEETYNQLIEVFNLRQWSGFREYESLRQEYESLRQEYESLRQEYESLRPVHNLDQSHNNVWRSIHKNNGSLHSCQKPLDILERIIKCSTHEGHIVLDPFMGSGSTGVACKNTNRHFIGIELDKKYFEIAKDRLKT